nr:unnamed protein product [Callosobruchus analis]
MKKIAKQHKAEDKVEVVKTGGGIFTPKITGQDEKILSILKNYFSINNAFESNSVGSDAEIITISVDQRDEQHVDECGMEDNIFVFHDGPSSSKATTVPQAQPEKKFKNNTAKEEEENCNSIGC